MSCEQICGKHIRLENPEETISQKINILKESNPDRCQVRTGKNNFIVKGPNSTDITITPNGKSPWYLIRAIKSSRKQINFLMLNQFIWGLEISSGIQMKKSTETYGKEKIADYLLEKLNSVFTEPDSWECIEFYH